MGRMKEHFMVTDCNISEPFRSIFSEFFEAQDSMRRFLEQQEEISMNERRTGYNSNTAKGHTNE